MDWLMGMLIIISLFALRLGLPLMMMAVVIYWLHRLETRWHSS